MNLKHLFINAKISAFILGLLLTTGSLASQATYLFNERTDNAMANQIHRITHHLSNNDWFQLSPAQKHASIMSLQTQEKRTVFDTLGRMFFDVSTPSPFHIEGIANQRDALVRLGQYLMHSDPSLTPTVQQALNSCIGTDPYAMGAALVGFQNNQEVMNFLPRSITEQIPTWGEVAQSRIPWFGASAKARLDTLTALMTNRIGTTANTVVPEPNNSFLQRTETINITPNNNQPHPTQNGPASPTAHATPETTAQTNTNITPQPTGKTCRDAFEEVVPSGKQMVYNLYTDVQKKLTLKGPTLSYKNIIIGAVVTIGLWLTLRKKWAKKVKKINEENTNSKNPKPSPKTRNKKGLFSRLLTWQ
jgi:hypothetical protein